MNFYFNHRVYAFTSHTLVLRSAIGQDEIRYYMQLTKTNLFLPIISPLLFLELLIKTEMFSGRNLIAF